MAEATNKKQSYGTVGYYPGCALEGSANGYDVSTRAVAKEPWQQETYAILRQNALRMLIATSPDLHTS